MKILEYTWNSRFLAFFASRTLSSLGDSMQSVGTPLVVLSLGYGATEVGLASAAPLAMFALFVIFGGVITDRHSAKKTMIWSDVGRSLAFGIAAFVCADDGALWLLVALLALSGVGTAFYQPGIAVTMPRLGGDLQRVNAFLRTSESVARCLGPAVAGGLVLVAPAWVLVAANAATFGVGALLLTALPEARREPRPSHTLAHEVRTGWQDFTGRNWLWQTVLLWSLTMLFTWGPIVTLGSTTVVQNHGQAALGFFLMANGAGGVAGSLVAALVRVQRPLFFGACVIPSFAVLCFALAVAAPPVVLGIAYFIAGAGLSTWLVMFQLSLQSFVPEGVRGRVHSFDVAGSLILSPMGRALAGPVALLIGTGPTLAGAGIGALGGSKAMQT